MKSIDELYIDMLLDVEAESEGKKKEPKPLTPRKLLKRARKILKKANAPLPRGNLKKVFTVLKDNGYKGWKECERRKAQKWANDGKAAIGISEKHIVVLSILGQDKSLSGDKTKKGLNEESLRFFRYHGRSVSTPCCGEPNERDVTKHELVFHDDGYYVCKKCGYRVASPELEDRDILASFDYMKVVAAMHYCTQCELLAADINSNSVYYKIHADNARAVIDAIRSRREYASKYSYVNSEGVYHCDKINHYILRYVDMFDINAGNMRLYGQAYESICPQVEGYYCYEMSTLKQVLKSVSESMDIWRFGCFVSQLFDDMKNFAFGLKLASEKSGFDKSNVGPGDCIIRMTLDPRADSQYIFNRNNQIKAVRINF